MGTISSYVMQTDSHQTTNDVYGEGSCPNFCFAVQTLALMMEPFIAAFPMVIFLNLVATLVLLGDYFTAACEGVRFATIYYVLRLTFLVLFKWVVIGRYHPGEYPIYGTYYLRHWLVDWAAQGTIVAPGVTYSSGWNFLLGNNFVKIVVLRALGADVSFSAVVTANVKGFDLVSIGPMASVHGPHHLTAVSFEGKVMRVGTQTIGAGAYLGPSSCIAATAEILPGACVKPLTAVGPREVVSGCWSGIPAQQESHESKLVHSRVDQSICGSFESGSDKCSNNHTSCHGKRLAIVAAMWACVPFLFLMVLVFVFDQKHPILHRLYTSSTRTNIEGNGCPWLLRYLSGSDSSTSCTYLDGTHDLWNVVDQFCLKYGWHILAMSVCIAFASVWFGSIVMVAVICRVLPKARQGMDMPLGSLRAQVAALKLILVSMISEKLEDASIQAAFFWLCGAEIGKDCILADQVVLPETLKLGDRCFFASHNVLTSATVDQGRLKIPSETVFGDDVFLGNWNHVPEGLPSSTLCGMRTYLPKKPLEGASFFGSPPVTFQRPAGTKGSAPTWLPKFWHHFSSGFIDVFFWDCLSVFCLTSAFITCRTTLPIGPGVHHDRLSIIQLLLKDIMVFVAFRIGAWIVVSLLFCNLIYSNRMPTSAPHYSCVVTRWYNSTMARKAFPQPFHTAGTMWHAVMMRLYGAKVGRRFFSANEQCLVDPPFATLGDDITLDYDAQIWQHSFEDMFLKFRPNSVGDGTSIMQAGELANSDAGPNVTLGHGSVTWKGQMLESGRMFHGAPAGYVEEDSNV